MRFIRAFRILPPIHIKEQQSHIREPLGRGQAKIWPGTPESGNRYDR